MPSDAQTTTDAAGAGTDPAEGAAGAQARTGQARPGQADAGETSGAADTSRAELQRTCAAARAAAPALTAAAAGTRATWLHAVADALDAAVDDLVAVAGAETSLGDARLTGEVARTTGQLRMFAAVVTDGAYLEAIIDHADPDATPPRPDVRRMLLPVGPVAVYAAGNFPFAFSVAGGDTASALAAGCPVVVKVHPGHPRTSQAVAALVGTSLAGAGAPDGTFAAVSGFAAGRDLVTDPAVRAAAFTGSVTGGRALFDLAAGRPDPIPFYGELGSINPVVVLPAASGARAADIAGGLVGSFTLGVGQFCTKPGVVLVPRGSDVLTVLQDGVTGAAPGTMLSDDIAGRFRDGAARLRAVPDVDTLASGTATADGAVTPQVLRTDVDGLLASREHLLEECFGPLCVVVEYGDDAALAAAVAALPGSLTATVHADDADLDRARDLLPTLRATAGRVVWNGWPTGVAVNWAMHHGGPWPATTASLHTSVGATAIRRFLRPIAYQDVPQALLPAELHDANPLGLPRRVDGQLASG